MSYESAQASAATGTVSDRVLLDSIINVSARRLVLGMEVAATKFLSGQWIDDQVREQEILESAACKLRHAGHRYAFGMEFFSDQIEANKAIQGGLHRYWDEHPKEFLGGHRHLTAELRLQLDIFNSQMLQALVRLENIPTWGAAISTACLTGTQDKRHPAEAWAAMSRRWPPPGRPARVPRRSGSPSGGWSS
jgi:chorismate mutase-like protein